VPHESLRIESLDAMLHREGRHSFKKEIAGLAGPAPFVEDPCSDEVLKQTGTKKHCEYIGADVTLLSNQVVRDT
jgi:hypothetical protein